jgi:acetate kinase
VYRVARQTSVREWSGKIERIGDHRSHWAMHSSEGAFEHYPFRAADHGAAARGLARWLETKFGDGNLLAAIGHRVVHGGPKFLSPQKIRASVLAELRRIQPYDPDHLPAEVKLIEWCGEHWPRVPQVACFDTMFHRDLPRVARVLPLPRRFEREGVRRYGFHGLSCEYLMEKLAELESRAIARRRVILAHLGSGVSLTAVRDGRSVDTTMAFTPTAGVPMSTRSGDLDPGVVWFLAKQHDLTPRQFHEMVNKESGLRGVSGTSADTRDLLAREKRDHRAADALAMFCQAIKKAIGALAASLGGLDTLVFAGGIGENSPEIRARCCGNLDFLGIELGAAANRKNSEVISSPASRVKVRVIPTDEELVLARTTQRLLRLSSH